jgi:hypothetical protein
MRRDEFAYGDGHERSMADPAALDGYFGWLSGRPGIGGGLYTVLGYVHPYPATPPAHVEDLVGWGLGFGLGLGLLVAAAIRA